LAPVSVLFAGHWVAAFPRQRNEARAEIRRLTQRTDVAGLAQEFSEWAAAKRAALPVHGVRRVASIFDHDSEAWAGHERRADEIATLQARARAEYHELFRPRVVDVLSADTPDPMDIAELGELAEKLRAAAHR
jgi:hypothetical protein